MGKLTPQDNERIEKEVIEETREKMRKRGLSFTYLLNRVHYLCEATKPISCIKGKDADGGTVDFVDVPDNQAIAKGVDIALRLGDYYPSAKNNHTGNITVVLAPFGSANGSGDTA